MTTIYQRLTRQSVNKKEEEIDRIKKLLTQANSMIRACYMAIAKVEREIREIKEEEIVKPKKFM